MMCLRSIWSGRILVIAITLLLIGAAPGAQEPPRVTMDFHGAELADVLHLLSQQCGVNIVLGGTLEGTVTANLIDTPFEDALSVILGTHGLHYHWEGVTVVVESKKISTRIIDMRYVDARKVAESLKTMVSDEGMIQAIEDPYTQGVGTGGFASRLVISDRGERVEDLVALAQSLDRPPVQVTIEAKFVETSLGDDERLGIRWNLSSTLSGATIPTTFPFNARKGTDTDVDPLPSPGVDNSLIEKDFPPNGFFPYAKPEDFVMGKLSASELSVVMEAIAQRRNAHLVSAPYVTTLDNVTAQILVGEQVPVALYERHRETGVMEVIGYDQQAVGVNLWVTPHVGDEGILLEVNPEVSRILNFVGQFNERPVTSTRTARTQVLVQDGETIVIGGMITETTREVISGVPGLMKIPLLGWFFRHKSTQVENVDLMIFITPRIIKG